MRVERLREEFDVEFEVFAYDLKPGLPPEGLPREQVYAGRVYPPGYVDSMREIARQSGIEMKRPAIIPSTRKAHEADVAPRSDIVRDHSQADGRLRWPCVVHPRVPLHVLVTLEAHAPGFHSSPAFLAAIC